MPACQGDFRMRLGAAVRGVRPHPDPPSTLGTHVVGVLGPPTVVVGRQGGVSSEQWAVRRPSCAPRPSSVLVTALVAASRCGAIPSNKFAGE